MDPIDELDAEKKNTLEEFQGITQSNDVSSAIHKLAENDWSLERAVQSFYTVQEAAAQEQSPLNEKEADVSSATPNASEPPSSSSSVRPRQPLQAASSRWLSFLKWPFGFIWNIAWSFLSFASQILPRAAITQTSTSRRESPQDTAARFLRRFESLYGSTHVDFLQHGYSEALNMAQRELRFLLVILQSDEHDDTEEYCRNTLTSPQLIEFLSAKNVLVWAGNVSDREACQVSSRLEASTYPFMAVIALRTHDGNQQKMTVVERIQGSLSAPDLIGRLKSRLERDERALNRLKTERDSRDEARRLRDEQNQMYKESLKKDQEKEREKERKAKEEREREERIQEEQRKRKAYIRYLSHRLAQKSPPDSKHNMSRIKFQLMDGTSVQHKFNVDEPIENLYHFIEVHISQKNGELDNESANSEEEVQCPKDYTHRYTFGICRSFPRTKYPPTQDKTLGEAELLGSVALIVEILDEDDDIDEPITQG